MLINGYGSNELVNLQAASATIHDLKIISENEFAVAAEDGKMYVVDLRMAAETFKGN